MRPTSVDMELNLNPKSNHNVCYAQNCYIQSVSFLVYCLIYDIRIISPYKGILLTAVSLVVST